MLSFNVLKYVVTLQKLSLGRQLGVEIYLLKHSLMINMIYSNYYLLILIKGLIDRVRSQ